VGGSHKSTRPLEATALIVLRTALVALTFFLLSVINRPAIWIALPVALLGAARELPHLTERPHLFGYALLAVSARRDEDSGRRWEANAPRCGRPSRARGAVGQPSRRRRAARCGRLRRGAAPGGMGRTFARSRPRTLWAEIRLPTLIAAGLVLANSPFPPA
jgi:hypothetical protein